VKELLAFLIVGLGTGICSGIFGIGGGIIMVPILVIFFGYQQHTATGTSLVAMLLPVGLLGVINYYNAGKLSSDNIKAGLIVAVGLFVGTYLGSLIALPLSESLLKKGFAVLLLAVAVKLWFSK
jgi:uncharacterized membrane protein YfcA